MTPLMLTERLGLSFEWYRGMVWPETGRLVYTYRPEREITIVDGSPIRDIAAIWDVERLGRFLARSELRPVVLRSLAHYAGFLSAHGGGLILDAHRLGEPASIAHSAFLALALLASDDVGSAPQIRALADAIVAQQRSDGSYRIFFGGEPDEGAEFYPGEAMLALMEAFGATRDPRYLASVERGFAFHRERRPPAALLVFYANWQSQYAGLLHQHAHGDLRPAIRDHVFSLHDRIIEGGFYDRIEEAPAAQATVEVACALEGLNEAYAIAIREQDARRGSSYAQAIRVAISHLLRAQRIDHCTARERGGFGHSLTDRTQRIDVTGHAVSSFLKTLANRVLA